MNVGYSDVYPVLIEVNKRVAFPCDFKWDQTISAPMSYSPHNNVIKFNPVRISHYVNKFADNLNSDQIIEIIACHEIGHLIDFSENKLPEGCRKLHASEVYEREQSAWQYGRKIVSQNLIADYDEFNRLNLEKHARRIRSKNSLA